MHLSRMNKGKKDYSHKINKYDSFSAFLMYPKRYNWTYKVPCSRELPNNVNARGFWSRRWSSWDEQPRGCHRVSGLVLAGFWENDMLKSRRDHWKLAWFTQSLLSLLTTFSRRSVKNGRDKNISCGFVSYVSRKDNYSDRLLEEHPSPGFRGLFPRLTE